MSSDFQQEVEIAESMNKLHRHILYFRSVYPNNTEFMITFNAEFQMNVDMFYTNECLYGTDYGQSIYGCPWFSDAMQKENFLIWKKLIP